MLELKDIESFYPENLRPFKANMLREYIQYKILDVIYASEFALRLVFMGGTAIHIAHGMPRFSEDLDFDNKGMNHNEFEKLSTIIGKKLALEGYKAEISNSFDGAYRSAVKFAGILYDNKLSAHKAQKLFIQMGSAPQDFDYKPSRVILNKFDVFTQIEVVPEDILLSQKLYAIVARSRPMGRDFYDAIYLFGKTKPNFGYLKLKMGVDDKEGLKDKVLKRCAGLNFNQLADDVGKFLFSSDDAKKIFLFKELIESL